MTTKMLVPFVVVAAVQSALEPSCPNFESYWVGQFEEIGSPTVWGNSLPTAAGNLITHLAAKQNGKDEAYPYNFGLDSWVTNGNLDTNDGYTYPLYEPHNVNQDLEFPQSSEQYYLGGQDYGPRTDDGIKYSLFFLMETHTSDTGTSLDKAFSGLTQYLVNTNRLQTYNVSRVTRAEDEDDYNFLKSKNPPYMLHINITCLEEDDYKFPANEADLTKKGSPLEDFYGDEFGHTIVVYNVTLEENVIKLSGASGLKSSRFSYLDPFLNLNSRDCDVTTTIVNHDQKCVDEIFYITTPTPAPNSTEVYPLCQNPKYGSYWVQPQEEGGLSSNVFGATCVPTAAGNLITYLESKAAGPDADPQIAYPETDLDNLELLDSGAYIYKLETSLPFTENGYPYLGGVIRHKTSQDIQGLYYAMKTNKLKGTLIEDGRTGLQQYLDDLKVLGAKTVEGINRTANVSDFDFLSDYSAPYLLHIEHKCLEQNDYKLIVTITSFGDKIYDNPVVDLKYDNSMPTVDDFHGSRLGHTITVYDTDINAANEVKSMSLYGASGLKASRDQNNIRHCAVTTTNVYSDQECIVGITRIVDRRIVDRPSSSSSKKKMSHGTIAAIVVVVVGGIAGAGYYVYRRQQQINAAGYMIFAKNFM
ncbi:MAG: hypothetical protein CL678_00300 [Bdellovibrionaceae bacterium]|nr:hypothetical protein [Pseudobdellovibrionaceae bacterium]